MCVVVCVLSRVQLSATPWPVAPQAPSSMGFSWQEHWSGWPFPPPGDLPDPGVEPRSPAPSALSGGFFTTAPPGKSILLLCGTSNSQLLRTEHRKEVVRGWGREKEEDVQFCKMKKFQGSVAQSVYS